MQPTSATPQVGSIPQVGSSGAAAEPTRRGRAMNFKMIHAIACMRRRNLHRPDPMYHPHHIPGDR
jgi:hypothetical protein